MPDQRPLDTSTLGPIRFDHDRVAAAAGRVRAVIDALRRDDGTDHESDEALMLLEMKASNAVLARLERMIRNG